MAKASNIETGNNSTTVAKKERRPNLIKELRKIMANFYASAKNVHITVCDNLNSYISNSFGYAPGKGRFPKNENLLWK